MHTLSGFYADDIPALSAYLVNSADVCVCVCGLTAEGSDELCHTVLVLDDG